MTQIADIADRLRRLAKRREDEGIYTDASLCNEAARALQAVGPEPAVAVKPLEWVRHPSANAWRADNMLGTYQVWIGALNVAWQFDSLLGERINETAVDEQAAKAAAEADYASRIRSALVDTPPAETVVEAANETTVRLWDFANGDYRYPAYRGRAPEGTPTLRGDIKATLDMLAILATKPAVKDDETVVEADFDSWWKASKYRQVIYADESQRQIALDAWRAALAAKDGRS